MVTVEPASALTRKVGVFSFVMNPVVLRVGVEGVCGLSVSIVNSRFSVWSLVLPKLSRAAAEKT